MLPHGYDGQGPEHSSARLERFLQLCDQDPDSGSTDREHQDCNMQVVYPTVPSNYFHALRRQVHREFRKPLIVFASKLLLRHPLAKSSFAEMTGDTQFQRLIPEVLHPNCLTSVDLGESYVGNTSEPRIPYSLQTSTKGFSLLEPSEIKTLIFCSGQVYYLLYKARELNNLRHVAIVRLEQLSPFPFKECTTVIENYPNVTDIVYAQEESQNSGAWTFVSPRLETSLRATSLFKSRGQEMSVIFDSLRVSGGLSNGRLEDASKQVSIRGSRLVRYAGRDISAAPATGIKKQHKFEEKMLVSEALFNGQLKYPTKMEGDIPLFPTV